MEDDALKLETVVVTAMGIKKKEASLTYSTQQLNGDELNKVKDANMINSLAGKSAGVQITKSSSGLGGSAKVSIRGARSAFASGNNQPLYVIDGVPMLNITTESTATVMGGENDGVNHDSGDGVSNLNPDDIESMSILKRCICRCSLWLPSCQRCYFNYYKIRESRYVKSYILL